MKKTSIVLLTILTIMMLTTSCLNDFLNVEPVSDTYSAKFWKTELEARTGLNSIYADFQNNFNIFTEYDFTAIFNENCCSSILSNSDENARKFSPTSVLDIAGQVNWLCYLYARRNFNVKYGGRFRMRTLNHDVIRMRLRD